MLAFILGLIIALLLAPARRRAGAALGPVLVFFLALFVPMIWAGALWLGPVGPPIADVSWLGFVLVALFLLLFSVAALIGFYLQD